VMKRIAAPMIGGLFTSFLMELLVYPAIYLLWRERGLTRDAEPEAPRSWRIPAIAGGAVALLIAAYMAWPQHSQATPLYPRYEAVRQALLAGSLERTKSAAKELDAAAQQARESRIAAGAAAMAKSGDVEAARKTFAELSDAMIAYRAAANEEPKPQIVYCSMVKHSWLQPPGAITNPYYADAAMRGCGELKSE